MLEIKVNLIPQGQHTLARNLDTIYVGNDGTGSGQVGHYDVYTEDPTKTPIDRDVPGASLRDMRASRPGWVGRIENFNRSDPNHRRTLAAEALILVEACKAEARPT